MVEEAIYKLLAADTDVAALVGTRIRPGVRPPDDGFPAITFHRAGTDRTESFGGHTGLSTASVQFDVWAETYAGVKTLADKVRLALSGLQWYDAVDGISVRDIIGGGGDIDDYIPPTDGGSGGVYRVIMRFDVWFVEPTA